SRAFKDMIAWVRKTISSRTEMPPEREMLIGELNEFFETPERVDRIPDGGAAESDPERIKLRPVKVNRKRPGAGTSGEEGGAGGRRRTTTEGGRTSGGRDGGGSGGTGTRGGDALRIAEL